jgi:hypothetical protein
MRERLEAIYELKASMLNQGKTERDYIHLRKWPFFVADVKEAPQTKI